MKYVEGQSETGDQYGGNESADRGNEGIKRPCVFIIVDLWPRNSA